MKLLKIRRVLLTFVTVAGLAGLVSSSIACGSDNNDKGTGTGGNGGSTGSGGSGGQKPVKLSYTFDTATSSDSMMWKLNDYMDPASPPQNLGWYVKGDAALADLPSFEWAAEDSESSSSSGSMKVSVTFTEYGQYVDPVNNLPGPIDLSNGNVSMKIRLLSGTFTGGVQFHISTGNYLYWAGTWMNGSDLTPGTWKQTSIDTSIPPTGSDPAMVVQVGIQIAAGMAPATGPTTPPAGRLVFEIDTVQAR